MGWKMFTDFKDFYDILRENLDNYEYEYSSFIDFGPDIFQLLSDLLNEPEITAEDRLKISAAIAYYVVPFDIIPESEYGPDGYIDDLFICVYVINELQKKLGYEYLEELWEGDEELENVIQICEDKSLEHIEHLKEEILKYVGLIE